MLLLTRDGAYEYLNKVTVAEITTKIRGLPTEVPLGRDEGLSTPSVATMENIRPVLITTLIEKIGTLSRSRHRVVKRAFGYALEWDELMGL